jgi:hypothetical protein
MQDEPNDTPADDKPQADEQPAGEQPTEQSEEQPAESDQPAEHSDEQPADSEQPADQSEEQSPADDQSAAQSEEQPAEGDQPSEESEEQPTDSEQPADQSEDQSAEGDRLVAQAEGQSATGDEPGGQTTAQPTQSPAPKRPYGVESWRPLVTEMAGDIPVEVLLRWIKRESEGNPCATGAPAKSGGGSIENGIFQLYSPDDDRFATPAQLHGAFCSGQTCIRDLTLEEARIQVASGIAQVNSLRNLARAHLKGAGVVWEEGGSDFWSLVKMEHNVPVACRDYLKTLRPASWSEFKAGVLKNPPKEYSGKIDGILSLAEDIGAGAV